MTTITIPKNLIKEGFVVLSRREYEDLLRVRQNNIVVKHSASFKVPKGKEKFYDKVDKDLTMILREVRAGKIVGPFSSLNEGLKVLKSSK